MEELEEGGDTVGLGLSEEEEQFRDRAGYEEGYNGGAVPEQIRPA